ncbi:putative ribonuclease H-like domain-containing protein [Tanacetum coccineum]
MESEHYLLNYLDSPTSQHGLEVCSIHHIQEIGYGLLEFLRVGTTLDIFQNIYVLYLEYDMIDYSLWEVIENGNASPITKVVEGVETIITPGTAEEKAQAFEKRFGGNATTKKSQRNLLKQQRCKSEVLKKSVLESNTNTIVWRNKPKIETLSLDDLYNNLKIYEPEAKWISSSNTNTQNIAFVSSNNTSSINGAVNTTHDTTTASTQATAVNSTTIENLSDAGSKEPENRNRDNTRRVVPVRQLLLMLCVLLWFVVMIDDQAKKVPTNIALITYSSTRNFMPPKPNLSFSGIEEVVNEPLVSEHTVKKPVVETSEAKARTDKPKVIRKNFGSPLIEDWISDSEDEAVKTTVKQGNQNRLNTHNPRGNQRNWNYMMSQRLGSNFKMINKACYVCGSSDHLQYDCDNHQRQFNNKKMVKPVWNYTQRVNQQNFSRITHPSPKRNMVPKAVLMKSGLVNTARQKFSKTTVSVNTARQVNTAQPRTTVNSARPMTNIFNKPHSTIRRPINNKTTTKNSNVNHRVNTVRAKKVNTARPKARVNVVQGNNINAEKGVIDSGCSRHMTGNMSYLTNYEKIDGGYVSFGGNPKGGKITGRGKAAQRLLFTWVFFLDTKDETSGILKSFIAGVENLINHRVKTANPPFFQSSKSSPDDGFKPSSDNGKKVDGASRQESQSDDQEKADNTNNVNAVSTNGVNVVDKNTSNELPSDPKMPDLKDIRTFNFLNKNEDDGAEADMNNLDTTIQVRPTPTIRIHKDYPLDQVIEDLQSATQIRRMTKNLEEHGFVSTIHQRTNHKDLQNCLFAYFLSQEEPKKVIHTLKGPSWIEVMQEEILQFKLQEVCTLVDLPNEKGAIGTKWVFRNKKDKRGIVIINKARLVAQGYTQEEGIDYDEVFAPIVKTEAIRLVLAYASFKDSVVYQMDAKSDFLYGKIEEEMYVCQPPGFEDLDFPDRVYKVEKALYGLHQAPKAWYETLSTYLLDNGFQRGKFDKTLFIKRHKGDILLVQVYVDDIVFGSTRKELCLAFEKMMHKKFQMKVKIASTPMETQKPLLKDEDGKEIDIHMYRSMIGSLMYLTSSRPDIMFAVCACARYQVNPKVSHLHDVKRIFTYLKLGLWYPKDSPFDLVAYTNSDYAGASLDRKFTTGGC